jgi:hypothetical protein
LVSIINPGKMKKHVVGTPDIIAVIFYLSIKTYQNKVLVLPTWHQDMDLENQTPTWQHWSAD